MLAAIPQDYRLLDEVDLEEATGALPELYSNLPWKVPGPGGKPVRCLTPSPRLTRLGEVLRRSPLRPVAFLFSGLAVLLQAWRLWRASRRDGAVLLLDMGDPAALLCCLLRSITPRNAGKVLAFGFYLYPWSWWKKALMRRAVRATDACAVWSRSQVDSNRRELRLPGFAFLFLPYKANHSQQELPNAPALGDYVFSGGNSERDYRTLFGAVAGLDIPVLVSCTDSTAVQGLTVPPNVFLVQAREPHFRRLMAGARLVVVPLKKGLLRGAGEATFLNAMWHSKPVVVADDVSAGDYIEDRRTGFVVPAGDEDALHARIVELWEDPRRCREIGRAGREVVESAYTDGHWRQRIYKLALVLHQAGRQPVVRVERLRVARQDRLPQTLVNTGPEGPGNLQ
jgi:glycosyltransferase involved in cell wall biosynthesis